MHPTVSKLLSQWARQDREEREEIVIDMRARGATPEQVAAFLAEWGK